MIALADGKERNAASVCLFDAARDCLADHDLAEPGTAIKDHERPIMADDRCVLVRIDPPRFPLGEIGRQHSDAVAVMAGEAGLNEVIGDDTCLIGRTAGGDQRATRNVSQFGVVQEERRQVFNPLF